MKCSRLMAFMVASGLLTACSLMPEYERPKAPVEASYPEGSTYPKASGKNIQDIGRHDYFRDPALQRLIDIALKNNRDLKVAALNVEAFRAQYRIQRADLAPTANVSAGGTRQRVPADVSVSGKEMTYNTLNANLGLSYELDFFGRVRSLTSSALEEYLASEEAHRSMQLTLVASVANGWFGLRSDQELLTLTRSTRQAYEKSMNLTQMRFDNGVASELDLRQARSALEAARSQEVQYERQVAQDINALQLLLGQTLPNDSLLASTITEPILVDIPVGLPAELLLRRPDILEAEHHLKSANANIGAARAAFFPSISLTASAGSVSSELSRLFDSGQGAWSFTPMISIPIFNAGRLSANLDYAAIQKDIRVAAYEKAIQTAFREVSDGLAARNTFKKQLETEQRLVETNRGYLKLAELRYQEGVDSYLTVLDAQRQLFASQQQLIRSRFNQLTSEVTLYKALGGGGWE